MESKLIIDEDGTRVWYNENNEFHREDGPAFEYADGIKEWFLNGLQHREDGPAYMDGNYVVWYVRGIKLTQEEFYILK